MGPLCVSDPEFGLYDKKFKVSASFCRKLVFFGKTEG
jgi:hypothetical protein